MIRLATLAAGLALLTGGAGAAAPDLTPAERRQVMNLAAERAQLDRTVWREERQAMRHEAVVIRLWDELRNAADPFAAAGVPAFTRLTLPAPGSARAIEDGVHIAASGAAGSTVDPAGWRSRLAELRAAGWRVVQTEFHHEEFHWNNGQPVSLWKVVFGLTAPDGTRVEWRGGAKVAWRAETPEDAADPVIESIDASGLERLERSGPRGFEPGFSRLWEREPLVHPGTLIAADLDGDGRTDLALTGVNVLLRNRGEGAFSEEPLVRVPEPAMFCAVLADVTGDGRPDLVVAAGVPLPRLLVYPADGQGRFTASPFAACAAPLDLTRPMVISAGDLDRDGRLDLWIGQYKNPYLAGQMPRPYWAANDGFPSYLLHNDGGGRFRDVTAAAGFAAKRTRRTYGGALLDLDDDGDLDLVTVNDFAGTDIWRNDGGGRFTDTTARALDEPLSFGMSLAADDFDMDGAVDLYVTGMASTTVRRLNTMGLRRDDQPDVTLTRTRMGFGSRLYLRTAPGTFRQPAFGGQVARSGWSWGVVAADVDLDGDRDLFVANGNLTGRSAADYCTRFWCHDLYPDPRGKERAATALRLREMGGLTRGEMSWDGFQKKRLYLNQGGKGFFEAGFALDMAMQDDAHNLVTGDWDGDGRPDLAMIYEDRSDPARPVHARFGLGTWLNRIPADGRHWVGVRLRGDARAAPQGAVVRVVAGGRAQTGVVVAGDSWASQQPPERLFGLGAATAVERIEVAWPDGRTTVLTGPGADAWHVVGPP